jgi:hypothetical protein
MVYYTHYVVDEDINFEYITHNDTYFIYKLYNAQYSDKSFLLLYHNMHGFNIIRESQFDMSTFESTPEIYFDYEFSSRFEYANSSYNICLERSMGAHKYMAAENDIEKYKALNETHVNVNSVIAQENSLLGPAVYHFAPNMYVVNICTMYNYLENGENKPYSSYIYIKYNDDTYQIRYELNGGNVYFM